MNNPRVSPQRIVGKLAQTANAANATRLHILSRGHRPPRRRYDVATSSLRRRFVVAGSEAALITAIDSAVKDKKGLLLQFWQPHWLQSKVALTQVKLPDVSDACLASIAAKDGKYDCDYPIDVLYKAASVKLAAKNPAALAFLSKMQLTTDQQNQIAAFVDGDKMNPGAAAQKWVDANPDVVASWLA